MKQKQKRGQLSQALWWLMWVSWFGLLVQQAADVERFAGTWALTGLRCLPLLCFLWAAKRDSLKVVTACPLKVADAVVTAPLGK